MKRCMHCRRTHTRMTPVYNRWVKRIDGYKCTSPIACIKRMESLGQWEGKRVQRRFDADGTEWTIRRWDDNGLRGLSGIAPRTSGYVLIYEHREHRLTSHHASIDAAKAHADEWLASFTDRNIEAYRDEPTQDSDQLELA